MHLVHSGLEKVAKEFIVAYFRTLFWLIPQDTKENHGNSNGIVCPPSRKPT